MATLSFPTALHGRSVYQKLREYRKRHELEWEKGSLDVGEDGNPVPIRKRARQLNDQHGNSVADIAYIVYKLSTENERFFAPAPKPKIGKRLGLHGESEGVPVGIRWADIADANFAKEWSKNVVHETLASLRKNPFVGTLWGSVVKAPEPTEEEASKWPKRTEAQRKRRSKYDQYLHRQKNPISEEEKARKEDALARKRIKKHFLTGPIKYKSLKQSLDQKVSEKDVKIIEEAAAKPLTA